MSERTDTPNQEGEVRLVRQDANGGLLATASERPPAGARLNRTTTSCASIAAPPHSATKSLLSPRQRRRTGRERRLLDLDDAQSKASADRDGLAVEQHHAAW